MNDNHAPTEENEESFEAMFEQTYKEPSRMEPGEKIEADIVKITPEWAFLQVGGKGEGYLDRKELVDAEGNLLVKEGDRVRAYFLFSQNGDMHFTTRIGSGPAARAQLEDACKNHIAVEGTISREMKGGFEITLNGGARAFCPFSQMGLRRGENTADYIGTALAFYVLECTERNVVLSRREIIEKDRQEKIAELKKTLAEGQKVKGTVTSIQNFGAFVDIGGVEGLLPVSEMAWSRTEKVSDLLSTGQPENFPEPERHAAQPLGQRRAGLPGRLLPYRHRLPAGPFRRLRNPGPRRGRPYTYFAPGRGAAHPAPGRGCKSRPGHRGAHRGGQPREQQDLADPRGRQPRGRRERGDDEAIPAAGPGRRGPAGLDGRNAQEAAGKESQAAG